MLSDRKWKWVALAILFLGCGGENGGITPPIQPPPVPPPPPPPAVDTVTVKILSPSSLAINQSGVPLTTVILNAEATSSIKGAIADSLITWREAEKILGKGPALTLAFETGPHLICVTAKSPVTSGIEQTSCSNFTIVPASPIRVELANQPVDGVPIDCSSFRAHVSNGSITDSADIGTNCTADISPRLYLLPDPGRVAMWVDAKNRSTRTHFPAYQYSISKDSLRIRQGFVMVPLKDPLVSGRWAGTTVQIDLEKACALVPDPQLGQASFYRCRLSGSWLYNLPTWDQFPVAAFDHDSTAYSPAPSDSSEVWNVFRNLSSMIGWEVLRAASFTSLEMQNRQLGNFHGIRIYYRAGISIAAPQKVTGEVIVSGNIGINSQFAGNFAYQPILGHEALHALGFNHTDVWGIGLMNGTPSVSRDDPRYGVMIPEEVAHMRVLYEVQRIRRETGYQYGIPQAHQGQRVLMLNLPPENFSSLIQ